MKRPQLISQGSLNRLLQTANEAWDRGDYQQCFEQLERASRLNPSNCHILLNLGERYGRRYQWAEAGRCFEKAVRVAPNKADILLTTGHLSAEFGNYEMAEFFLKRALEQTRVPASTIARLAELYERLHRPEDAAALIERALQQENACPLACLIQAKLHRQAGRLAKAEHALRSMLVTTNRELRIKGWYELGAICDRAGRYDEAMSAFLQAKEFLLPDAPPLLSQLQVIIKHLHDMRERVSAEMLTRWSESSGQFLQTTQRLAFLGGHARSGTTLLEQVLDSHPDIVSAEETTIFYNDAYAPLQHALFKEINMLTGLDTCSNEALKQGRERYFQSMAAFLGHPPGTRLLIDKNPSLQAWIIAFIRFFPEARMIIALRDPRDVVLSCFMQPHWPISTGSVTFLNLETTVRTYTRVMGIWQTLKPLIQNPVLEIHYEDMVEDLDTVARRTLDFLGVSWDDRVLGFAEHARKKLVRSPTYADVIQPVYKRAKGRWRNYQKYLEPYLTTLEPFIKAFGYE